MKLLFLAAGLALCAVSCAAPNSVLHTRIQCLEEERRVLQAENEILAKMALDAFGAYKECERRRTEL